MFEQPRTVVGRGRRGQQCGTVDANTNTCYPALGRRVMSALDERFPVCSEVREVTELIGHHDLT